jgi:hypothetical protein
MDKIFYNEASAAKMGWEPDWFGADDFDDDLIEKIITFQKEHDLTADGLCGPSTHRRIWTDRESRLGTYEQLPNRESPRINNIIYNNDFYEIEWPKVILHFNHGGMHHTKGFKKVYEKRKPNMFVCHWDVCLNSESCFRVLERRGCSIHFTIDNDGTIRQHLDMNHVAVHAGSTANKASVGVEISNAYYPRYSKWYKDNNFGERPLVKGAKVHGKSMKPFMDFYPVQIEALKALMKACHKALDIPLKCPVDRSGKTSYVVNRAASKGTFDGFVSHYHITRRKIDCANLDLKQILEEIK